MYYILLDPGTQSHQLATSNGGFPDDFTTYEQAKEWAEALKNMGACAEYEILGVCTDERNHII